MSSSLVDLEGSSPSYSIQSILFWLTLLLILITYLVTTSKSRFFDHVVPSHGAPALVRSIRVVIAVLVGLHSAIVARRILYEPINLFTHFNLPLTTSINAIRATLKIQALDPTALPPHPPPELETLLTRLTSLQGRLTYLKYGPTPLTTCPPTLCTSQNDFPLFIFPSTAVAYLTTLILCSLATVQRVFGRGYWRRPAMLVLAVCFGSEWWWCLAGTIGTNGDGMVTGMTYTRVHFIRNTVLFLLPLVLHHIPPGSTLSALPPFIVTPPSYRAYHAHPSTQAATSSNINPIPALNSIINGMGSTLAALNAYKLFRVAGSRNVGIRERIADYHTTIARNAALVRDDPLMSEYARKEGFGYRYSHSEKEENVDRKTPVEDDQSFHQEDGSNAGDGATTSNAKENSNTVPDLKLRNKAREGALGIINAYVLRK